MDEREDATPADGGLGSAADPESSFELLAERLASLTPFDALHAADRNSLAVAGRIERHRAGDVLLDAFDAPAEDVFVVLEGRVELWEESGPVGRPADTVLGSGGLFGFSALLTGRAVGPRAVAARDVVVARLPRSAVEPVFASRRGARFLAGELSSSLRRQGGTPTYGVVDELLRTEPLVVAATLPAAEVARLMTERDLPYAVIATSGAEGSDVTLLTDRLLRERLVAEGRSSSTPAGELAEPLTARAVLGDSAVEALMNLLEHKGDLLVVTDRAGVVHGVLTARDFAVSPSLAGVALHEQLRRSSTVAELTARAQRVPDILDDLLARGLSTERVISVHSSLLDTIVRRAIDLVFSDYPDLSGDAFTWIALGSVGRREAVLGSDVDSAVAFLDQTPAADLPSYRRAFGEIGDVLAGAGLSSDDHGATAEQPAFSRTNASWRSAAQDWMAGPERGKGAVMAALLVDGRPIHGDPGLPAATQVMAELRSHVGTMRLLLVEALAARASLGPRRGLLTRRSGTFDVKHGALQPIVRIARWAALTAGSSALGTVDRLRAGAGTAILPHGQAETLSEVFDVLQGLRLRHQLHQHREGQPPTDALDLSTVSAIDRAVIAQAVREVAAVQRRMANVSVYADPSEWTHPQG